MSKYQTYRNAIDSFQSGGENAPILYSQTEVNGKGFKALLGRKLKLHSLFTIIVASIIGALIFVTTINIIGGSPVAAPGAIAPIIIIIFFFPATLIVVGDKGLDFYFLESKLSKKIVIFDKMTLPYDKITDVKIRTGRFNTGFTFKFSINNKKYKVKTSIPNKRKDTPEQAENLKYLNDVIMKINQNTPD